VVAVLGGLSESTYFIGRLVSVNNPYGSQLHRQ
jgi:hypothetical protein